MYGIETPIDAGKIMSAMGTDKQVPSKTMKIELSTIVDLVIASIALVFLAPLMLMVAIAIKLQDGGPVMFGHVRIGRHGKKFRCLKFRSMVTDSNERLAALLARDEDARREWAADHKLRNDPRITPLGAFLRKSSLDELPQLLNVLRGEMSLVGPRPIVDSEVVRYGRAFPRYCSVLPGVTGLWQVSGRNNVSYRRRVALDVLYAKRKSFSLYCYILLKTLPAVLLREGSY
ncbi:MULTISPECIES: sugar transferase [unclassified Caulobacter]|uniref:sugar transferase n=1 Tax=unclassified Caulobacter TaxID=2648921 RepID=UPI000D3A6BCB|nr:MULTISPECIES: sugar transferase [unclassified Caulobacter]PTS81668.1 UDP-phosphate galactose phosphotransferase [Caulobacter sp. HMWF009]PTT07376.1 UDP-phosphate galactose phosphotransferase [Caulobacter sp. HMWF025]